MSENNPNFQEKEAMEDSPPSLTFDVDAAATDTELSPSPTHPQLYLRHSRNSSNSSRRSSTSSPSASPPRYDPDHPQARRILTEPASPSTSEPGDIPTEPVVGNNEGSPNKNTNSTVNSKNCYDWSIPNWTNLTSFPDRLYSPDFVIANYKWRVLLFPHGNVNTPQRFYTANHNIAVYVQVLNLPPHSTTEFFFNFELVPPPSRPAATNAINNFTAMQQPISKQHAHRFSAEECDRGFAQFTTAQIARDNMFPDGSIVIKVTLTPKTSVFASNTFNRNFLQTGISTPGGWSSDLMDTSGYDSKTSTGMVGFKNQGATCYMNSMLQTLFHLPTFRQIVYAMPSLSENNDEKNSKDENTGENDLMDRTLKAEKKNDPEALNVALALQRLFYELQFSKGAVGTEQLTRAFGWTDMEAFMQHDVQEFCRVLLDNLDEKMKKTAVEGRIGKVYEGKSVMRIECMHVEYVSERTETFLDLAMNVKNCEGLEQSFSQYVEEEILDKENKYRANQFGLQDARKSNRFETFPPVLQLQLKRFEYDFQRDGMVKINDRFTFPLSINLFDYMTSKSQNESKLHPEDPPIYHLHSVLVHSGSVHGGHYYCFIRPFFQNTEYQQSPWFKFDDEMVTKVTEEEAVNGNFGGEIRNGWGRLSVANAYMLVYVRESVCKNPIDKDVENEVKLKNNVEGRTIKGREETETGDSSRDEHGGESDAENDTDVDSLGSTNSDSENELRNKDSRDNAADDSKLAPSVKLPLVKPNLEASNIQLIPYRVSVPRHLRQRFEAENRLVNQRKAALRRSHHFLDVKCFSEFSFFQGGMAGALGPELRVGKAGTLNGNAEVEFTSIPARIPSSNVEFGNWDDAAISIKVKRTHSLENALKYRMGDDIELISKEKRRQLAKNAKRKRETPLDGTKESEDKDMQISTPDSIEPTKENDDRAFEWEAKLGIPIPYQQHWFVAVNSNAAFRPSQYMPAAQRFSEIPAPVYLFVRDIRLDSDPLLSSLNENAALDFTERDVSVGDGKRRLLLLKWFDVASQTLSYLGSMIVHTNTPIDKISQYVWELRKRRQSAEMNDDQMVSRSKLMTDMINRTRDPGLLHASTDASMKYDGDDVMQTQEEEKFTDNLMLKSTERSNDGKTNKDDIFVPLPIQVWEEKNVMGSRINSLKPTETISSADVGNGEILVFQLWHPPAEVAQMSSAWKKKMQTARSEESDRAKDEFASPSLLLSYAEFSPDAANYLINLQQKITHNYQYRAGASWHNARHERSHGLGTGGNVQHLLRLQNPSVKIYDK